MSDNGLILISSCLIGMKTTYLGKSNFLDELAELFEKGNVIPVCPEQLGGLPTPRLPSEIVGGQGSQVIAGTCQVMRSDGKDVTENFIRGAEEVIALLRFIKPVYAIFKENSPSCGVQSVYDGTFSERLVAGEGVTTALLKKHGIRVVSEKEFLEQLTGETQKL